MTIGSVRANLVRPSRSRPWAIAPSPQQAPRHDWVRSRESSLRHSAFTSQAQRIDIVRAILRSRKLASIARVVRSIRPCNGRSSAPEANWVRSRDISPPSIPDRLTHPLLGRLASLVEFGFDRALFRCRSIRRRLARQPDVRSRPLSRPLNHTVSRIRRRTSRRRMMVSSRAKMARPPIVTAGMVCAIFEDATGRHVQVSRCG